MNWPDWTGQTAVIVGTGPSVKSVDLNATRGLAKVFVVKSEYKFYPDADALYGIDKEWWLANRGARDFNGLKFSPSPTVCRVYRVRQVKLKATADILVGETGVIGCGLKTGGGHSGFQAINLAVQFGAKRILLVGFDMTGDRRLKQERGVSPSSAKRLESWRSALDECAPQFEKLGVTVINCSPVSALTAYPKMDLVEALLKPVPQASRRRRRQWGSNGGQNEDHAAEPELRTPDEGDDVSGSVQTAIRADRHGYRRGSQSSERASSGEGAETHDIG